MEVIGDLPILTYYRLPSISQYIGMCSKEGSMITVELIRDRSGKIVEGAGKVAGRYARTVLQKKIMEVMKRKLLGE